MVKLSPHKGTATRRNVVTGIAATPLLASCLTTRESGAVEKPNIIYILADDLGYADLSCYGRRDYETPNLDQLAKGGIKFTSAYANSPVCSPTRLALMTGRYQYRYPAGLEEPLGFADVGLTPELPTLPSELKKLGYQTSLVGKWHLGQLPKFGPLKSGYDEFYGYRSGGVDYFDHSFIGQDDLWDGDVQVEENGYLTELLGDRAVSQIEQFSKLESPFFLSLHFSAPHWPWQSNDDAGLAESERIVKATNPLSILHYDGGDMQTYADMVTSLDHQVGRVMKALKRLNIEDNTIIVFASDNGGERFSDNWPFTGQKGLVLEGGTRIPTILRWPTKVKAGTENDVPIITMDWVPTLLKMAGAESTEGMQPDGVDIADLLSGKSIEERPLFWRYNLHKQKAVRLGRFKYVKIGDNEFLFDVVADPMERGNLKYRQPDVFEDLKNRYETWNETMLPYTEANSSHGISGEEIAEFYGVTQTNTVTVDLSE